MEEVYFNCKCPDDIADGIGGFYHLTPIDCVTTKEEIEKRRELIKNRIEEITKNNE